MAMTNNGGMEGMDFQLNLLAFTLLRAHRKAENYTIQTELGERIAGKFDDLMLKYDYEDEENKGKRYCVRLFQMKHKLQETHKIGIDSLLKSESGKDNIFCLYKYFDSYRKIMMQEEFKNNLKDIIIFTNLNITDDLKEYVEESKGVDKFLDFLNIKNNNSRPMLYKFKKGFIEEYKMGRKAFLAAEIIEHGFKKKILKKDNFAFSYCQSYLMQKVFDGRTKHFQRSFILPDKNDQSDIELNELRDLLEKLFEEKCKSFNFERKKFKDILTFEKQEFQINLEKGFGCNGDIDDTEDLQRFFEQLTMAINQPNERELEQHVLEELKLVFTNSKDPQNSNVIKNELIKQIKDRFKTKDRLFNDEMIIMFKKYINKHKKNLLCINDSEMFIKELMEYDINFKAISCEDVLNCFREKEGNCTLSIQTADVRLTTLKVIKYMERERLYTENPLRPYLLNLDVKCKRTLSMFHFFIHRYSYNWLIIENAESVDLSDILPEFDDDGTNKKIIIIEQSGTDVNNEIITEKCIDTHTFKDLTIDTQTKLLEKEVIFQENTVTFRQLIGDIIPDEELAENSWCELISNKEIVIAGKICVCNDNDNDVQIYMNREIECKIPQIHVEKINQLILAQDKITYTKAEFEANCASHPDEMNVHLMERSGGSSVLWRLSRKDSATYPDNLVTIETITDLESSLDCFFQQNIIILSDSAGSGKSIFLSNLAKAINHEKKDSWVVYLTAINTASVLSDFDKKFNGNNPISDESFNELLSQKLLNLSTPLEVALFEHLLSGKNKNLKLVLLFDGFDELGTDCQKVLLKMLKYLKQKDSVLSLMVITTRPHMCRTLELNFHKNAFTMKPMSRMNNKRYLTAYWLENIRNNQKFDGLNVNTIKDRLQRFSQALLIKFVISIKEKDSNFTGIPQQIRMLAEIYENDAIDFTLAEGELNQNIVIRMPLYELYEKFLNKKIEIYKNENKYQGTSFAENVLRTIHDCQKKLALQIMFGESKEIRLHETELKTTLNVGIVYKNLTRYFFIHKTFAEFFVAQCLLDCTFEIPAETKAQYFKRVLVEPEFQNVRTFINSKVTEYGWTGILRDLKDNKVDANIINEKSTYKTIMFRLVEEEAIQIIEFIMTTNKPEEKKAELLEVVLFAVQNLKINSFEFILDWLKKYYKSHENIGNIDILEILLRIIEIAAASELFRDEFKKDEIQSLCYKLQNINSCLDEKVKENRKLLDKITAKLG